MSEARDHVRERSLSQRLVGTLLGVCDSKAIALGTGGIQPQYIPHNIVVSILFSFIPIEPQCRTPIWVVVKIMVPFWVP